MPADAQTATAVTDVVTMEPELWIRHGAPPTMTRPHRHDDLEINVVVGGALEYLHGGEYLRLDAGTLAVFWGATPHRLLDVETHRTSEVCWIHVPLSTVLGWGLPEQQLGTLLTPHPVVVPAAVVGRDIPSTFRMWEWELARPDTEGIALLEAQAFVRRALRHHMAGDAVAAQHAADGMGTVVAMARFALENFRDPITATDIARAVHLTPNYAMSMFHRAIGTTLGAYLIRCRVAEAQRLLITTELSTTDVAVAAGFGSQSAFYEQFARACGRPPGAYRRALR